MEIQEHDSHTCPEASRGSIHEHAKIHRQTEDWPIHNRQRLISGSSTGLDLIRSYG